MPQSFDPGSARPFARRRPAAAPRLRVVLWGINYAPEPIGIAPYTTELAEHLRSTGAEVEVVTGFAYYPAWRKAKADRGRWFRTERIGGVPVHRCWQLVPRRLTTLGRMLHEATFVLTSFARALWLRRADLYVVVSPPLGLGPAAWLLTRLKRSRYLFQVQDLQPDSAVGVGLMSGGPFLRLMYACERWSYRGAAGLAAISPGMVDAMREKGVPAGKIFLLPNWARRRAAAPATAGARFRRRQAIADTALLAVYSGNFGRKQGLEVLLDAAEFLEAAPPAGRPVVILLAGDGAARPALQERLKARPLTNLRLLPLQEEADYQAMLRAADLALITQRPGTGRVCFPSKLLSVVTAGLPVVSAADEDSDLARAVREGGFGQNVAASDAVALAAVLREAADDAPRLREWKARTDWAERFAPHVLLPRFELALQILAPAEAPRRRPDAMPQSTTRERGARA